MDQRNLLRDNGCIPENNVLGSPGYKSDKVAADCDPQQTPESSFASAVQNATGLTEDEVKWKPWCDLLPQLQLNAVARRSALTIAEFVEHKFVPERVSLMGPPGRMHYQAMLKHLLMPEEVERLFLVTSKVPRRRRLRAIPDWPYIGHVRLCDADPSHVQQIVSAAMERGYSSQTVTHIRNTLSAIFSHAKRELCLVGGNPVSLVRPPELIHKQSGVLTPAQVRNALAMMTCPEKEMVLMIVLTGMNVSEICGLQWRQINLTDASISIDEEIIPPRTIAVRRQWYRGEIGAVKRNRIRNLPIAIPLLDLLPKVHAKTPFNRQDDFVFSSRTGSPVNEANIMLKRLTPIARELGIPALSWQMFRRTRNAFQKSGVEVAIQNTMAIALGQVSECDAHGYRGRNCREQPNQSPSR